MDAGHVKTSKEIRSGATTSHPHIIHNTWTSWDKKMNCIILSASYNWKDKSERPPKPAQNGFDMNTHGIIFWNKYLLDYLEKHHRGLCLEI
jgi:hypothetical protein